MLTRSADGRRVEASSELRERECAWSRVIGVNVKRRAADDAVGYGESDYGVQFGGQKELGGDWFLGASYGYDSSTLDASSVSGSVKGQSSTFGLLLKRQVDDWLFSGGIDAGWGKYYTQRGVSFGDTNATASGEFKASHFGLHARAARQIAMSSWYLKPYVDLHATRLQTSAYTETGAGVYNLAWRSVRQKPTYSRHRRCSRQAAGWN